MEESKTITVCVPSAVCDEVLRWPVETAAVHAGERERELSLVEPAAHALLHAWVERGWGTEPRAECFVYRLAARRLRTAVERKGWMARDSGVVGSLSADAPERPGSA